MTTLNQLKAVEYAPESPLPVSVPQHASGMRSLFFGPRGLGVGRRLLIFIGLLVVLFGGAALVIPWWLWVSASTIVRIATS